MAGFAVVGRCNSIAGIHQCRDATKIDLTPSLLRVLYDQSSAKLLFSGNTCSVSDSSRRRRL